MSERYNEFSKEYNDLFEKNINEFIKCIQSKKKYASETYCMFYPSFGIKREEKCTFLFCGQAVNGWDAKFVLTDKKKTISEKVDRSKAFSNEYCAKAKHNPLDWVNVYWNNYSYQSFVNKTEDKRFYEAIDYKVYRSFFWNVIYKLVSDYFSYDRNSFKWSGQAVWSNLYKITGNKRNPDDDEKEAQKSLSIELVKKELEELKPRFCIVLTNNSWWQPFAEGLQTMKAETNSSGIIQSIEEFNGTKIIVTSRPATGNSNNHVEEILKVIGKQKT